MKIAFLHPDLGLGGAERLVVDAALELGARGHEVTIFTSAHDPARAFPATVDGRLDVRVRGAFLPTRVAGRLQALCTMARVAWLAQAVARARPDAVICDVVPFAVPLLRRLVPRATRIIYYCHFPDQLLAPPRAGLYRLYRAPIDRLEVPAMRAADRVVVNSEFTRGVIARFGVPAAEVVYPGVDVDAYGGISPPGPGAPMILSISRFDPRKNLGLAVEALARLAGLLPPDELARVELVLAGGFDPRQPEDAATAAALEAQAARLGVGARVRLARSPTDPERLALLERCRCVVYTPTHEHFGLVPVEGMAAGRAVVAAASGGPLETVVDGETGYLRPPTPDAFAGALAALIRDPALAARMGVAGRARAARFSRRAFGDALEATLACGR
jgi:alpha-1,3/alpha-1,6-mannosyltransferase